MAVTVSTVDDTVFTREFAFRQFDCKEYEYVPVQKHDQDISHMNIVFVTLLQSLCRIVPRIILGVFSPDQMNLHILFQFWHGLQLTTYFTTLTTLFINCLKNDPNFG